MMNFKENATVRHARFGIGRVRIDDGESILVRFEHGIEECLPGDLELVKGLSERVAEARFDPTVNVITKILGNCIVSVNDSWGSSPGRGSSFSPSALGVQASSRILADTLARGR